MKDARNRAIYVGKGKNLKRRLSSYFRSSASLGTRIARMVQEAKEFDYIVTKNELEALVLETHYIKRLKPKYNIVLRDDKNYPFLKLDMKENWPRLEVVRRTDKNNARYFGPYIPSGSMWELLRIIGRNFPIRTCRYNLSKPMRPCVRYEMKRCLAPCMETRRTERSRKEYDDTVREVILFLQGEKKELLMYMEKQMKRYSEDLRYEEAALIRDRLRMLEKAWTPQRIVTPELGDMDVIGLYHVKELASIFILFIRNGMVLSQKDFLLQNVNEMQQGALVASFLEQFYAKDIPVPPRIIIPSNPELTTIREWLQKKRGSAVRLSQARGNHEKKIYRLAEENARYSFFRLRDSSIDEILISIRDVIGLKNVPSRICAIDISNISGAEAVGVVVVWENGIFMKDDYRIFKIRTVSGIDDTAMIGEVAERYNKIINPEEKTPGEAVLREERQPDLILIDGGRGQLSSALKALKSCMPLSDVAAIAKAKVKTVSAGSSEERLRIPDRIYLPGKRKAVHLQPVAASTHLLQRIRDEAHRFAISRHKLLHAQKMLTSPLENVRGIGKKRRLLLLRHFRDISGIKKASVDELAAIKGMNKTVAAALKRALKT